MNVQSVTPGRRRLTWKTSDVWLRVLRPTTWILKTTFARVPNTTLRTFAPSGPTTPPLWEHLREVVFPVTEASSVRLQVSPLFLEIARKDTTAPRELSSSTTMTSWLMTMEQPLVEDVMQETSVPLGLPPKPLVQLENTVLKTTSLLCLEIALKGITVLEERMLKDQVMSVQNSETSVLQVLTVLQVLPLSPNVLLELISLTKEQLPLENA